MMMMTDQARNIVLFAASRRCLVLLSLVKMDTSTFITWIQLKAGMYRACDSFLTVRRWRVTKCMYYYYYYYVRYSNNTGIVFFPPRVSCYSNNTGIVFFLPCVSCYSTDSGIVFFPSCIFFLFQYSTLATRLIKNICISCHPSLSGTKL